MQSTQSTAHKALAISLGLFLFGQLFVGGNTADVIVLMADWSVVVLIAATYLLITRSARGDLIRPQGALIAGLLALSMLAIAGITALVSVQPTTWLALPGHDFYTEAERVRRLVIGPFDGMAVSIDPAGTVRSLLVLAPSFAIFIASVLLSRDVLLKLLGLSVIFAVIQAAFGLFQIGFGTPSLLSQEGYAGSHIANGTFISKNSYATFLAMHLPLVLIRAAGQFTFFRTDAEASALSNVWWGVAAAVIAAALVASLSRAGSTAGFAVGLITVILCGTRQQSRSRQIVFVVVALLALLLAWLSSLDRLLASMSGTALSDGVLGRQWLTENSFAAAKAFWPLGAGLGSYAVAIQRFQTPEFVGFIEYAHNDYAQLIFETGAISVAVLVCLAVAAALVLIELVKHGITSTRISPAVGCFLGAVAFAIHAWFDFPAHIPGIVIAACLLFAASTNHALVNVRPRSTSTPVEPDGQTTARRKRRSRVEGDETTSPVTIQPNPWITQPSDTRKS